MRMTREEWDHWTRGSAIRRAGHAGFGRNVAVAIGNWLAVAEPGGAAFSEAVDALRDALEDDEPLVREHAALGAGAGTVRAGPGVVRDAAWGVVGWLC